MTGLDTNVLVRFLTADDPGQYARVGRFLDSSAAESEGTPGLFVPPIVVCELLWVLETAYGYRRDGLARALRGLLETRELEFGDRDAIEAALKAFEAGKRDFPDYYIRESCRRAGCEDVATLDGALLKEPGFRAP